MNLKLKTHLSFYLICHFQRHVQYRDLYFLQIPDPGYVLPEFSIEWLPAQGTTQSGGLVPCEGSGSGMHPVRGITSQRLRHTRKSIEFFLIEFYRYNLVVDPGFPRGRGANSPGGVNIQHT